ncbi:unnamed protein product [Leptidea sinapis]|uniref:Phospholipid/glycerol acyltransferase domain-containing protein n=1 Tax=Leptidea sinapis TaxID=189913 RepID=A0A5E4R2J5_9NEOP|nr:unnamed protein product [Leptidea sinapis]
MMGFVVRYFFLLPLRILIFFIGVITTVPIMFLVGMLPNGRVRRYLGSVVYKVANRMLIRSVSCVASYHDTQHMPETSSFCVANHTSIIDVCVLSNKSCFCLIGQRHNGFLGLLQRALARASPHIWFERSEVKDRHAEPASITHR